MKYVIMSIYDGWYRYTININGKEYDEDSEICKKAYKAVDSENKDINDYLLEEFKEYDLIVICDNGNIEILKDNRGD